MAKNISKKIPIGTEVITKDNVLQGSDGKSTKTRMAVVVDSNYKNELGIVKYTTSKKNGRRFKNKKGFKRHGNTVYIEDINSNPIIIDNQNFFLGNKNKAITKNQANEIKRRNIKESKRGQANRKRLRKLKGRKKRDS